MNRVLESTRAARNQRLNWPVVLLLAITGVVVALRSFGIAIGNEVTLTPVVTEPTADEWAALIKALGGVQGAGTLGAVALGVQGLIFAFRSRFVNLTGPMKFLIVSGLTMVAGPLALVAGGVSWQAALLHSGTLAAAQVFADQAKKQLIDKKKP